MLTGRFVPVPLLLGRGALALVALLLYTKASADSSIGFAIGNTVPDVPPISYTGTYTLKRHLFFDLVSNPSSTQYYFSDGPSHDVGLYYSPANVTTNAGTNSFGNNSASILGNNGIKPAGLIAVSGQNFSFTLGPHSSVTFPLSYSAGGWFGFTGNGFPDTFHQHTVLAAVAGAGTTILWEYASHNGNPSPPPWDGTSGSYAYTVSNPGNTPKSYDITLAFATTENACLVDLPFLDCPLPNISEPIPYGQHIEFQGTTAEHALGEPPFGVGATATSGLPVALQSLTPTICSVQSGVATLLAAGTCTISADQPGNLNTPQATAATVAGFVSPPYFFPAPSATMSFSVRPPSSTANDGDVPIPPWAELLFASMLASLIYRFRNHMQA